MCPSKHQPFTDWVQKHKKSVKAAARFFKDHTTLFDAMHAVWQHLSESERRELCSLFNSFDGIWSTDNLRKVMALRMVKLDEIDELCGCFLMSKEDPSVFVEPCATPSIEPPKKKNCQWVLDEDYAGFTSAPKKS